MRRPDPSGNKAGVAPGTELPEPKKTKPQPAPKPTAPSRPKHPMGPRYAERPSVWQSLADIMFDKDDR